jgi:tRNA(adenine34) deaminase
VKVTQEQRTVLAVRGAAIRETDIYNQHIIVSKEIMNNIDPQYFMNAAYQEALKAFDEGDVPVGAVVEKEGRIIGRGYNRIEKCVDATAHAEVLAIGAAATVNGSWRLAGCTLYVTLEPCLMCLGAILQSRIDAICFAARDPRFGAVESFFYRQEIERAYHFYPRISSGLMHEQCSALLKSFFDNVRTKKSS